MISYLARSRRWLAMMILSIAVTFVAVDFVEARRGGSFGSRGSRTWVAPAPTQTAPRQTAPVERSMTPRQQTNPTTGAPVQQASRPGGLFGGFGGGILGGLLAGGLLGMLLGTGFGGFAGFLGLLVQVAAIALIAMLVMRFMRGRSATQRPAYAGGPSDHRAAYEPPVRDIGRAPGAGTSVPVAGAVAADEIGVTQADLDTFERLLQEVQDAYGREDYAALRARTTPEIMGFLSEELGQNATRGLKNEVSAVKLLQGDVSESWREGANDYATVALRYESLDVTRERATGRVVEGDPDRPTEVTELWTFVRERGGDWRLSAIQEA